MKKLNNQSFAALCATLLLIVADIVTFESPYGILKDVFLVALIFLTGIQRNRIDELKRNQ